MIRKIRMGFLKMSYSRTYIITILLYLAAGQYAVTLFLNGNGTGFTEMAYGLADPYFIITAAAAVFTSYFTHMENRDGTFRDYAAVAPDRGSFAMMKFWTLAAASLLMSVFEAALIVIEAMLRTHVEVSLRDIGYAALIFGGFYIMYLMLYAVFELISLLVKSETMSVFLSVVIAWGIPACVKLSQGTGAESTLKYLAVSSGSYDDLLTIGIGTGVSAVVMVIIVMISCAVARKKSIEKACY